MNKSKKQQEIGRLALRVEGQWWNAYYAMTNTMEGAILLGSIQLSIVRDVKRKEVFMALMTDAISDIIKDTTGISPTWPTPPRTAPEHERSGNS